MSTIEMNCPAGSSRRNLRTSRIRLGSTVSVSSPNRKLDAVTAPGIAASTFAPMICRSSSIQGCPPFEGSAFDRSGAADFLLQHQNAVEQGFGGWRATRHVDVDGYDPVAAADHRIGIMVIAAAIGAGSHRDDVARLGHLVVDLAQRRRHFVG